MLNYGTFITPEGLKNIENYRYKSSEYTYLDNLLNPFWTWAASFVPLSVAPNLVTLAGTAIAFSNCVIYFSIDSTMEKQVPDLFYYWSFLTILLY